MTGHFEVDRFCAAPVTSDVAVVELDGRFTEVPRDGGPPRLLVEAPDGERLELPALAPAAAEDGHWHASYAVPAERLHGTSFTLELPDLLLELPTPDADGVGSDRLVAVARELNALRAELERVRRDRDRLAAELAATATATAGEEVTHVVEPPPREPGEIPPIDRQGPRRVSLADSVPAADAALAEPSPLLGFVLAALVFVLFVIVLTWLL